MHVMYTSATYLVSRLLHTTVLACDAQVPALIREDRHDFIVLQNNAASRQVSEEHHSQAIRLIKPAHNDIQAGLYIYIYIPVMVGAHGNH